MTRPQRADAQRNRDKLLTVAVAAFTDLGADVPLETIAAQAGVGVGTLYRHFPNRNALIEAAYRHEVERLCEAAPELLATHEPAEALHEWMERFAQYAATKRGMGDALRSAIASGSPLFERTRTQMAAALKVLLEAGTADGSLRDDADPEDVLRAMGAVWSIASGPEWQDQMRRLLNLLVDGLRYGARNGQPSAP